MKIGIIGAGHIGAVLGRMWAAADHEVMFATRHPDELDGVVDAADHGARAGSPEAAIAFADVVVEAIPYRATLDLPGDLLTGKILVNVSNYYPRRDGEIGLAGMSQSEFVARRLPGARVVKAFNMMAADDFEARANGTAEDTLAIFVAGDDGEARGTVMALVEDAGFAPIDAGALGNGMLFQSGEVLYERRLTRDDAIREWTNLLESTG